MAKSGVTCAGKQHIWGVFLIFANLAFPDWHCMCNLGKRKLITRWAELITR